MEMGLIDHPDKPRSLSDAIRFLGTCEDMCPEFEMHQREYQNNVEKWEIVLSEVSCVVDHIRIQILVVLISHELSRHFTAPLRGMSSLCRPTFGLQLF